MYSKTWLQSVSQDKIVHTLKVKYKIKIKSDKRMIDELWRPPVTDIQTFYTAVFVNFEKVMVTHN